MRKLDRAGELPEIEKSIAVLFARRYQVPFREKNQSRAAGKLLPRSY